MKGDVLMKNKYRWIYLWIATAALLTISVILFVSPSFRESFIFYITGALLIIFVIIRFVPLIKTTRESMAIALNAIEMFVQLLVGILIIVFTAKFASKEILNKCYPFLIGGVLYIRAVIYFVEISFLKTKPEKIKFFVHLLILTAGTIIMARYDAYEPENLGFVIAVLFALCGLFTLIDGSKNYHHYRKLYIKPKKEKKSVVQIETPVINQDDINEKGLLRN